MEQESILLSLAVSMAMLGVMGWLWLGLLRDEREESAAGNSERPVARLFRIDIKQGDSGMWFATSVDPDVFVSGTTFENVRKIVPEAILENIEERNVVILPTDRSDCWVAVPIAAISA